ncbi:hypothetical protein B484DRAFT_322812 [Ochromonadaceae sp. CCMP2298]|nr:hypothetical protein B484DRAFT_322812 [Ochromonadaceae sp. CCMP2298]
MCRVSTEDYASAFQSTCKENFSEGRSGAFLFYSSDQRFVCKSTTKVELTALRRIMPTYVQFLAKHPNSLLCRFVGAHCLRMYGNELNFLVMMNVFPSHRLEERFDLKGSWVNRHGFKGGKTITERSLKEQAFSSVVYMDNDLQSKISLGEGVAAGMAEQIFYDVGFVEGHNLMDYFLLVGVKMQRFQVPDLQLVRGDDRDLEENDGGLRSAFVQGPGRYYCGIIDVLQEWNFKKRIERFAKVYLLGQEV